VRSFISTKKVNNYSKPLVNWVKDGGYSFSGTELDGNKITVYFTKNKLFTPTLFSKGALNDGADLHYFNILSTKYLISLNKVNDKMYASLVPKDIVFVHTSLGVHKKYNNDVDKKFIKEFNEKINTMHNKSPNVDQVRIHEKIKVSDPINTKNIIEKSVSKVTNKSVSDLPTANSIDLYKSVYFLRKKKLMILLDNDTNEELYILEDFLNLDKVKKGEVIIPKTLLDFSCSYRDFLNNSDSDSHYDPNNYTALKITFTLDDNVYFVIPLSIGNDKIKSQSELHKINDDLSLFVSQNASMNETDSETPVTDLYNLDNFDKT